MLVKDLMSKPARSVPPSAPVSVVERMFENHGVHHVAVVDDGRVVGVVTPRDIEVLGFAPSFDSGLALGRLADHLHSAGDAMSGWPVCIGSDQPLARAAELLSTGAYHALPVLDEHDDLVGFLTTSDLAGYLRVLLLRDAPDARSEPE